MRMPSPLIVTPVTVRSMCIVSPPEVTTSTLPWPATTLVCVRAAAVEKKVCDAARNRTASQAIRARGAFIRAPRQGSPARRSGDEKADMGHLPIRVALVEEADEEVREDDGEQHEESDGGELHLG